MLKLVNPATEDVFETLEESSPSDIKTCLERARTAQKKWFKRDYSDRKAVLGRFCETLLGDKENCARTMSLEMGKPYHQALGEIENTVPRIKWFMDNCEEALKTKTVFEDNSIREKISQEPLGVVLNISAWNFPYFIGSNVFAPALLTGNAVLYKPSEITPLTGLHMRRLLVKSGLDKDLFQVMVGGGDLARDLLAKPLDGVFFTGSHRTGQKIAQQLAGSMTPMVMELGGKDPAYVMADADVEKTAAALVDGAFYNAGQSCCSVERIYVNEKVYDNFVEIFVAETRKLTVGDPLDKHTYMGPLARQEQLRFLDQQCFGALEKGASELVGGSYEGKGYFYKPRVFTNVDHSMSLMRDESFGPVIGLMKVKDDAEALRLMNDTAYGLTASVHGKDFERARWLMSELQSGTVYFNACDRVSPYVPWSGRKSSGLGSTLSTLGIQEFIQPKSWQLRS